MIQNSEKRQTLLKTYQKEIFRPECNPEFQSLHCIAHLEQDISEVLPYLNAALGGFEYLNAPPAVVFKVHGKLITVQGNQIAVNALKDENEADKILGWLRNEINSAWQNRKNIEPSYEGAPKPKIIEILRLLPQTNCGKCGEPTCMVFATRLAEGIYTADQCPEAAEQQQALLDYMDKFHFD